MFNDADSDENGASDSNEDTRRDGERDTDSRDARRAALVELAVVALSVVVTVSLFGFAALHVVAPPPSGPPRAHVTGTTRANGHVVVTVVVRNPQNSGLRRATAQVSCRQSSVRVQFSDVPARGRVRAQVACPANTTRPKATLVSWMEV